MFYTHLYAPPIYECRYAQCVYMNPDVEFKKVSKIVFNEILIMLGMSFTTKQSCLHGSDTDHAQRK